MVSIKLSSDFNSVIVKAQMNKDTHSLLRGDTYFWIQKPRMDKKGVSGLSTILSGYYIELSPGTKGVAQKYYEVQEDPPIHLPDDGLIVVLETKSSKDLSIGDLVLFKGLEAGFIYDKNYDFSSQKLVYKCYIDKKYSMLVSPRTNFWINNGVAINFGSDGLKISSDTIQSMFKAGISFDIPDDYEYKSDTVVQDFTKFKLFDNKLSVEKSYTTSINFIIISPKEKKELSTGSPVMYRGVQVGRVEKAPYLPNDFKLFKSHENYYAYLISIQPERFEQSEERTVAELHNDILDSLKNNLLTARFDSMNLLTGKGYINLVDTIQVNDKSNQDNKSNLAINKPEKLKLYDGFVVIPSSENELASIQESLNKFSSNLASLNLKELSDNLNQMLKNSSSTTASLTNLSNSIEQLVTGLQQENFSAEIVNTLKELQKTLDSYQDGGQIYGELKDTLENVNSTLNNVKPVINKLNEKSNSLIFEYEKKDPIPGRK